MTDTQILEAMRSILEPIAARLERIEESQQKNREDIATLNSEIVPKINRMYDCLNGVQEKFNRLDLVESKVEGHEHRLFGIEEKLKKQA